MIKKLAWLVFGFGMVNLVCIPFTAVVQSKVDQTEHPKGMSGWLLDSMPWLFLIGANIGFVTWMWGHPVVSNDVVSDDTNESDEEWGP